MSRVKRAASAVVVMVSAAVAVGVATAAPQAQAAVAVPGCQSTAAPAQTALTQVRTRRVATSAGPFGLVYTPDATTAFAGVNNGLTVLSTTSFTPTVVRTIALPQTALGLAITKDGRYVVASADTGAYVVDVARAKSGAADAVLGKLTGDGGTAAIQVTLSADDRYAFVTQEYGNATTGNLGNVEVFDLAGALASGFTASSYVGRLNLGKAVVGSALSRDGKLLHVTSQNAADGSAGTLSVIDVATLVTKPAAALRTVVKAGCNPVRVSVAPDGATVWVTARGSNAVLAFDSARLASDPANALLTWVRVGTAPVGAVFTANGTRLLTADSNRFNASGAVTGISVVNVADALAGRPSNRGRIPTGTFPREFALRPGGGTILASLYGSNQIQAIATSTLP